MGTTHRVRKRNGELSKLIRRTRTARDDSREWTILRNRRGHSRQHLRVFALCETTFAPSWWPHHLVLPWQYMDCQSRISRMLVGLGGCLVERVVSPATKHVRVPSSAVVGKECI